MNLKKLFTGLAAFAVVATSMAVAVPSANGQINDPEFDVALAWAYDSGLTRYNVQEQFNPYGTITREQVARFASMWASTNLCLPAQADVSCSFSDVATADYTLVPYVEAACRMGLVKGYNGMYGYGNNVTKAEFTTMISRAISAAAGEMAPSENVEPWWANHYNAMRALGVTKETSAWDLDKPVTRYEAALMLYRSRIDAAECGDDAFDITDILNDLFGDDDDDMDDDDQDDDDVAAVSDGTLRTALSAMTPNGATVPGNVSLIAATFDFTAQSEDVTLNSLQLERRGLGSKDVLSDVVIYANGEVVSRARSFSSTDRMANINLNPVVTVRAGQTVKLDVVVKVGDATTVSSEEFQISLNDFTSNGNSNTSNLPIAANTFKVGGVNGASVTVRDDGSVSDVELGDMEATVARFEIENDQNDAAYITSITLKDDENNASKNLTNFKLVANGDVIATTANASRRNVTFNLDTPFMIGDRERQSFRVHADVIAGAGDTIEFTIDQEVFVRGYDDRFGFGLAVDVSNYNGQAFTINAGQVTLARASLDSLKIRQDRDDNVLAEFDININAGKDLSLEDIQFDVALTSAGPLNDNLYDHFENIEMWVWINGVRRSYDLSVSANVLNSFSVSDDDLSIFLPENGDVTVQLVADTIPVYDGDSLGERFRVTLNAANLKIIENSDDEEVENIVPSVVTFETLTFVATDVNIEALSLTNVNVVKGSTNVDLVRFVVETDDVSDAFVQGFQFNGTATSGFDQNTVSALRLWRQVSGGWELLQEESGFRLSSGNITFDRFGDVLVEQNQTQVFLLTIDIVDDSSLVNDTIVGELTGARISDDRNKRLINLGDALPNAPVDSGRTITITDSGDLDLIEVTNSPVDRDMHIVAGGESPIVAGFELVAVNEAIRIERARINVTTGGGIFNQAVKEVIIYDEDMTTELYRRQVVGSTTITMNNFNLEIPEGSTTIYVAVVTDRIGNSFNGAELQDVNFAFQIDEAYGVSSSVEVTTGPVAHGSDFDVLAVHLSDVRITDTEGTIANNGLNNLDNIIGVIELTANTWTNTNSTNGSAIRALLDDFGFIISEAGGASVDAVTVERLNSGGNSICDAVDNAGVWEVNFATCATQVREIASGTVAKFRVNAVVSGVVDGSAVQLRIPNFTGDYITYSSTDGATTPVTDMRLGKTNELGRTKSK